MEQDEATLMMRGVRDALLAYTDRHEVLEHNGFACVTERLAAVAWLCHCLGIKAELAGEQLPDLIRDFDARCKERHDEKGTCR